MSKIKILHRLSTAGFGGTEKYVLENYKYIDRKRFVFEGLSRNEELLRQNEIVEAGLKVNLFHATGQDGREQFIKEISEILEQGYSAVHMNTSFWTGFLIEEIAMHKHLPKVIVHSHSSGIDTANPTQRKKMQEKHEYYKNLFDEQYATHFCACSHEAARWLYGPQIPTERIIILKNGVEVDKFIYNVLERKVVRERMGLEHAFVIGHVGGFNYSKNHSFLIDVFKKIYDYNPRSHLMLVGDGEHCAEAKKQVEAYNLMNNVHFMGWREDIATLLQAMDLFVLPSNFEGLPISLIEAQTAGLQCIASTNVTKEADITHNVEYLQLDKDLWVEAIRQKMKGYKRLNMYHEVTEAGYNIKESVKRLEELYES